MPIQMILTDNRDRCLDCLMSAVGNCRIILWDFWTAFSGIVRRERILIQEVPRGFLRILGDARANMTRLICICSGK